MKQALQIAIAVLSLLAFIFLCGLTEDYLNSLHEPQVKPDPQIKEAQIKADTEYIKSLK